MVSFSLNSVQVCIDVECKVHDHVAFCDEYFYHRQEPKYTEYGLVREIYDIGNFKYLRKERKIIVDCMIPNTYILDPVDTIVDTLIQLMHLSLLNNELTPIHASVVWKKDKSIIILGNSGAGKSTLQMALLQCGYSFFGDDGAIVDKHGYLHANMVKNIAYTPNTAMLINKVFATNLKCPEHEKGHIIMPLLKTVVKPDVIIFPDRNVLTQEYVIEEVSPIELLKRLIKYHVSNEYAYDEKTLYWERLSLLARSAKAYSYLWSDQLNIPKYLNSLNEIDRITMGA